MGFPKKQTDVQQPNRVSCVRTMTEPSAVLTSDYSSCSLAILRDPSLQNAGLFRLGECLVSKENDG